MVNFDKIIKAAIEKDASDIHLIAGQHAMFRIKKALIAFEEEKQLKAEMEKKAKEEAERKAKEEQEEMQ